MQYNAIFYMQLGLPESINYKMIIHFEIFGTQKALFAACVAMT